MGPWRLALLLLLCALPTAHCRAGLPAPRPAPQRQPACPLALGLTLSLAALTAAPFLRLEAARRPAPGSDVELAAAPLALPHYRAVLVVLASQNAPFYHFCRGAWLALADAALQDGVRVVLLYGLGSLRKEEETPFDLVVNFTDTAAEVWGEDGTPGMPVQLVNKTLMALPILLERFTFDYLVRTNIHTFWDARRLAARLAGLPSSGCLAGHKVDWLPGLSFVSGIDFIISADLVQPMVDAGRESSIPDSVAEDIALSIFVHGGLKVPILDTWYGEPGGRGPLVYFLTHGNTREAALEEFKDIFKFGCDHVRLKPWPVTSDEGYRNVRIYLQLAYGLCIGSDECELTSDEAEELLSGAKEAASNDTALLRPPFSNPSRVIEYSEGGVY